GFGLRTGYAAGKEPARLRRVLVRRRTLRPDERSDVAWHASPTQAHHGRDVGCTRRSSRARSRGRYRGFQRAVRPPRRLVRTSRAGRHELGEYWAGRGRVANG